MLTTNPTTNVGVAVAVAAVSFSLHRLPPEFYSIKVEDDETNKKRGTFENLKCNNEPWWKDLYAMPYISDMHENIQSVTGISSSQSNVVKKGEIGSSVHETSLISGFE